MNRSASKPWYNFLNRNDGQTREVLPLRTLGSVEECNRCFIPTEIDTELDAKITSFVCKSCRLDNNEWSFKASFPQIPITVEAMENQMSLDASDESVDENTL